MSAPRSIAGGLTAICLGASLAAAAAGVDAPQLRARDPFLLPAEQGMAQQATKQSDSAKVRVERPPAIVGWVRSGEDLRALTRGGAIVRRGGTISGWTLLGESAGVLTLQKGDRKVALRLEDKK